ncbi:DUF6444 domain-containing protein [Domibacillus sp. A3M-37]|uniref:DUF6444 domain-containing protein n=1 Tax=Domibacillus sp. A3M-37 TaxID=2962037 RepID=UPI0020B6A7C8|nr:DUF6444 domain-containing protein [Domibacillus sp. A3M-37]MCP3764389.1 DUF6444 domain-containing protein [Domibacillus sp. A3M-37]
MSLEKLSKAELLAIIERQAILIEQLTARVAELEKPLGKNSRNSHKPPSSDGFKKVRRTKSERKPSGKSSGGQSGHSGHHLPFSSQPDYEIGYPVSSCSKCGTDLSSQPVRALEKRQVWDLPPLSLEVTEHQAEQAVPVLPFDRERDIPWARPQLYPIWKRGSVASCLFTSRTATSL